MATFFKTPAPPGVVLWAEDLFATRAARGIPVVRAWRRDSTGQLVGRWAAERSSADASAEEPLSLALAS
jgi:hypothetical protein